MFITTANSADLIPPALYDRMEVVEITGYTEEEKFQIAKKHLVPKQLKLNGVRGKVKFENTGIKAVIEKYTRESGVRNLEREIGRVCARCAKKILEAGGDTTISITAKNITEFLGTRKCTSRYISAVL
jgi:ATP-dependent Lon protease